uniref:DNA replication complex GINS protein PSF1 n=1 Tax=Candidozyma auris TaxID=498019 RepID=A0A0L0NS61_CANAR
MYGDLAQKLLLDGKRTSNLTELPLYQLDLVKDIVLEITDLKNDVDFLNEQELFPEDASEEERRIAQCQIFVRLLYMRRNKRCLLAHQKLRADKINEFLWLNIDPIYTTDGNAQATQAENNAGSSGTTKLALNNLSHPEQEYYKQYQDLILDFKSSFADIDLSGNLEPPTDIFIDVRVLKDGGEIQTEYGVFNLIKDSQFYVRKSDVDRLIQQGYLEQI